jgi:hypothetical protein
VRRGIVAAIIAAAIAVVLLATAGPPAPTPLPPGAFAFAVLGDAPYYRHEELQYRVVRKDLDQHELASVIHIGDIFWRPCSDAMFAKHRRWLDELRHPVIYTPGDNEWYDCWEPRVGAYDPFDRLAELRKTFYPNPARSLGRRSIPLHSQPSQPENARWRHGSVVFATVHMIGSRNGREPYPNRPPDLDTESAARTAACTQWMHETFEEAQATNATAVVIAFHGGASFKSPPDDYRTSFEPFLSTLEEEARRFAKPVLIAHGDWHEYTVDRPSPRAPNLIRLQVPGSPDVGWVLVTVQPGGSELTFQPRVVPRWKYW